MQENNFKNLTKSNDSRERHPDLREERVRIGVICRTGRGGSGRGRSADEEAEYEREQGQTRHAQVLNRRVQNQQTTMRILRSRRSSTSSNCIAAEFGR